MQQRLAAAVRDNFVWSHERLQWLAALVSEHFSEDGGGELPDLQPGDVETAFELESRLTEIDRGTTRLAGKILIGMRGCTAVC